MIKRNTVIIIGNGFDLAHGFPTKYSDFGNHVLNIICNNLINDNKNKLAKRKTEFLIEKIYPKIPKTKRIQGRYPLSNKIPPARPITIRNNPTRN